MANSKKSGPMKRTRPATSAPRGVSSRPVIAPPDAVKPDRSATLPADAARTTGEEFGIEGTNKTVALPKADNAPPDELGLAPHVEKTPYTRG